MLWAMPLQNELSFLKIHSKIVFPSTSQYLSNSSEPQLVTLNKFGIRIRNMNVVLDLKYSR
jgi:hypothetical protein